MGLAGSTAALRRHLVLSLALLFAIFVAGLAQPEPGGRTPQQEEERIALPRTTTTTTTAPTTTVPPSTTLAPFVPPTPTTVRTRPTTTTSTTRPSTPTTAVPRQPCGGSLAKAGGGQWQCTWSDEFEGTALDRTKWIPQTTAASSFHSGQECFVDSPNNIAVSDGTLRLTARWEGHLFPCTSRKSYSTSFTSGMVMTYGRFTQAFGRFEIRAKLPAAKVRGLQTSFWMWPEDPQRYGTVWPASGEIDIAEAYSLRPDRVIPYIHYLSLDAASTTNNYCMVDDVSQFHTYTLEWTPQSMTILYDGKVCLAHRWAPVPPQLHPQPFDQPFMLALTQALGIGQNAFDANTPLPATTVVDYVRVWK